VSTYRLQFGAHLTFQMATGLVAYLADLGIGDAYASPLFRSRESSSHGYDVIDHGQIDPALGTEADFVAFAEQLHARRMGLMMDVVPNHMGIDDPHNEWWQDVLENGVSSIYARFFDIDWDPPKEELKHKVLLPILGDQYGRVLENREIQLVYQDQRFQITCYGRRFPLAPRSWADVLRVVLERLAPELSDDEPDRMELESIITELDHLPPQTDLDPEHVQQRYREKEVAKRRLSQLLDKSPTIAAALELALVEFNGRRGDPASFDRLEALLAKQAYRLCHWRVATDEINYRRFFDINELAAIRVEDAEVFAQVHSLVFRFIDAGWVTAVRIDHPDGLLDPQQYFENLQQSYQRLQPAGPSSELTPAPSLYIAVEKILAPDEHLPPDWPVSGTTGYEFLNLVNGLFVHPSGAAALRRVYARFIDENLRFADVLYESKRLILNVSMSSELHVLAGQLDRISEQHRFTRDFTRTSLRRALREVISCFPVYRTYIRPQTNVVTDEDRRRVATAIRTAKRRNPALSPSFFDFIASVLLLEDPDGLTDEQVQERRQFVLKFQQVTGPVTAKGFEDTAFYRYYPLASLNEVGGEPNASGTLVDSFHRKNTERFAAWPNSLVTTATHDTKRGEDVRARLNVLSEVPDEWEALVRGWRTLNERYRVEFEGATAPDDNEEYLLYETLVGTWPLGSMASAEWADYVERIVQYMDKALKEAKTHSSWLNPNQEYDAAVANFVRAVLNRQENSEFIASLARFVADIADPGFVNSLAQTLLKICAPGIPDFYQGTELWDFNLVDPDNRRPVDFELRRRLLGEIKVAAASNLGGLAADLLAAWPDPRIKLMLIWRALGFRQSHLDLFQRGNYLPLVIEGPREEHACAFGREFEGRYALVVVPRFTFSAWRERWPVADDSSTRKVVNGKHPEAVWPLADWWRDTVLRIPAEVAPELRHVLTGHWVAGGTTDGPQRLLDLSEVFGSFPVALLEG
jgi:(1->4)-alpha-D-glucan 1-alpha-D-glucosylmutase